MQSFAESWVVVMSEASTIWLNEFNGSTRSCKFAEARQTSVSAHEISIYHLHAGMCGCRGLQSLGLASMYRSVPASGAEQMHA